MSRNDLTIYVGNLSEEVTEDLLYELFLQAGPVANVNIIKQKPFGFVQFKHQSSVLYAMNLMDGISLFGKTLKIALPKGASNPIYLPPLGISSQPPQPPTPQLLHPLSAHGRLSAPSNFHRREDQDDKQDPRDRERFRSRHNDHMMPSKRSTRNRSPPKSDIDTIPDFLGSQFDPLYYRGGEGDHNSLQAPMKDKRRESNFDRGTPRHHHHRNRGSRHTYSNSKRENHSQFPNHRRHF